MRSRLALLVGRRTFYVARLCVYGVRHFKGERRVRRGTALMKNVRDRAGGFLTGHVWVPVAEPFHAAGVERGQHVSFTAIAVPYLRGHGDEAQHGEREQDYCLQDAQDVVILDEKKGDHSDG